MKKAFDQTVRDLKRGVNKKVLKVPRIEQKILDATSNEPWGPHGSLLADIAQATMNYHEYQMIMNVIWKRINDTGKNWRHVYKALTVLEYLVGHGSEQVIDNIREHAYQISTLSEFQYIDSSGRDQGNNVRRKSQALVALVNDKERLQEVRQKAAANREKFQSTYSNRPGSHPSPGRYGDHYDDDRYESRYASRDDYQYGNGTDRDWGYKDDDRSGRVNDSHGREEDRYDRDGYRDNEHRGGDYGSRNMSIGRNRSFDDDNHSIRSVGGRVDDLPQDERQPDRRLSEQSSGAPPSYEDATRDVHNHVQEDRNPGKVKAAAPIAPSSSAPTANSPPQTVKQGSPSVPAASSSVDIANQGSSGVSAQRNNNKNNGFGEFDPRGLASVAPPAASSPEMDLFGSTSASDPIYSLALVPLTITGTGLKTDLPENSGFGTVIAAKSSVPAGFSQPNEDLFGDAPFKTAQESLPYQKQSFAPVATFNSSISSGGAETLAPAASMLQTTTSFSFDGSFGGIVYNPISNSQHSDYASAATLPSEAPVPQPRNGLPNMLGPTTGAATFVPPIQEAQPVTLSHIQGNNFPQSAASFQSQATLAATNGLNLLSQPGLYTPITTQVSAPTSASASMKSAPPKDRFETRSTVWADTLSRGLVNLNISGPKINPHADIGVDFDSINRKDKWKGEKKTSAAPLSTTTMGKAMGSGSGIGRVGASVLAAPSNTGMSFGMRMPMGNYGPSTGMAMNQGLPPQPAMGAPGGGYNPVIMGNYGSQQPYGGGYR